MAELPAVLDFIEHVTDAPPNSEGYDEIRALLERSYLDEQFTSKWLPAKIQLVNNTTLETEYEEKKQDMLVRGRREDELVDSFGFALENCVARLELIPCIGLQARDSEYNALGYNRMGIYLCRHADVSLQHSLIKHSGDDIMRLVIYKYIPGRKTTAIPRVASASEFIEPTQGFDTHVSVIPPGPKESLQNQYDRSQVYLYEINKLLQPCSRPRQAHPYAIVSYTVGGQYLPAIDARATSAEKLASNPRLQHIVSAINSKTEGPSDSKTPPGVAAGLSVAIDAKSGVSPQPGVVAPGVAGMSANGLGGMGVSPVLSPGMSPVSSLGRASNSGSRSSHSPSPEVTEGNQSLNRVISQINARLKAEERSIKQSNMANGGSHLVNGASHLVNGGSHLVNGGGTAAPPHPQPQVSSPLPMAPTPGVIPAGLLRCLPQPGIGQNGLLPSPQSHPHTHPHPQLSLPKMAGMGLPGMLPHALTRSAPLGARHMAPDVTSAIMPGTTSAITLPAHNFVSQGYLGGATPGLTPANPWQAKDVVKIDYGQQSAMLGAAAMSPHIPATHMMTYPSPAIVLNQLNQPMKRQLAPDPYRLDEKRMKYY